MRPELGNIIKRGMPIVISDLVVDAVFLAEFESCRQLDSSLTEEILVCENMAAKMNCELQISHINNEALYPMSIRLLYRDYLQTFMMECKDTMF